MTRPAARAAAVVTLAYLLATLPLFWRAGWTTKHAVFVLGHVIAVACVSWSITTRRLASPVTDWLPLLLVPFLYAELPFLTGDAYRDAVVQAWESSVFGTQPARTLAGAAPGAALSELLHLGYLLYYPIVYVPPLALYLAGRMEEFGRTLLGVMLTYVLCYLVFVIFPVEGPRYAWGAPTGIPGGPIRSLTLAILERGSSRGTAFPSSHAAVAVAQAILALRYQRRMGVVVAVSSVLLMLGAVYGGFHYAVDVLAGAALGAGIAIAVAFGLRLPGRPGRFTTVTR
jgi:membrane-associated phospholipid phosphatase